MRTPLVASAVVAWLGLSGVARADARRSTGPFLRIGVDAVALHGAYAAERADAATGQPVHEDGRIVAVGPELGWDAGAFVGRNMFGIGAACALLPTVSSEGAVVASADLVQTCRAGLRYDRWLRPSSRIVTGVDVYLLSLDASAGEGLARGRRTPVGALGHLGFAWHTGRLDLAARLFGGRAATTGLSITTVGLSLGVGWLL